MDLSEQLTYATTLINCYDANGKHSAGTGFIMDLQEDENSLTCIPVLFTNYHVIENSQRTSFKLCKRDISGKPTDKDTYNFEFDSSLWVKHPDNDVDLCCLLLGPALNELRRAGIEIFYIPLSINMIPDEKEFGQLPAMEDILMLGYPIGLSDRVNNKPVIRKGATASHPGKDYQGKMEILLDIPCFPGSSGSPVFIFNRGTYSTPGTVHVGDRVMLLGIAYGMITWKHDGNLKLANLPIDVSPIGGTPINLGVSIKSLRLLDFKTILTRR